MTERQKTVVLTMMSAGLGACRGHAVVPMYATEKKGNKTHYEIHAAFNTTVAALVYPMDSIICSHATFCSLYQGSPTRLITK
jgi:hypothetical protein